MKKLFVALLLSAQSGWAGTLDDYPSWHGTVVVLFTAPWCGPCQQMKPVLAKLKTQYKFRYVEVNVDQYPAFANQACQAARQSRIPLVVLYQDGEYRASSMGVKPAAELVGALNLSELKAAPLPAEPLPRVR